MYSCEFYRVYGASSCFKLLSFFLLLHLMRDVWMYSCKIRLLPLSFILSQTIFILFSVSHLHHMGMQQVNHPPEPSFHARDWGHSRPASSEVPSISSASPITDGIDTSFMMRSFLALHSPPPLSRVFAVFALFSAPFARTWQKYWSDRKYYSVATIWHKKRTVRNPTARLW
jgi:hypothetical protein